jgi:hypothetical protein
MSITPSNSEVIPSVRKIWVREEEDGELEVRSWTWMLMMTPA